MSTLSIISQALAYDDEGGNSNPNRRPIDWKRTILRIPVDNPSTEKCTVDPNGSRTVIDGARLTWLDGTTVFSLASSPLSGTRYRVTTTGGTAPAFREDRDISATGFALTFAVSVSLAVTVTSSAGTPFTGIIPGDVVFIPGLSTGDTANVFNILNEGYWTVLAVTSTVLTMARPSGAVFTGFAEVVTPVNDSQFQAFSTLGVQVGDTVELAREFASTSLRMYDIVAVNPSWIEFESTVPLGAETGIIPGMAGLLVYTAAKRWLSIEVDQECVIRLNDDNGDANLVTPWIAGDVGFVGAFTKTGPVWKLVLVNRSSVPLQALILSAE